MAPLVNAKRVVIKIGSALLVDTKKGELRLTWLKGLAQDIVKLHQEGRDVVLVSSGSIALGRLVLGLSDGALSLDQSQAAAAVGQIRLARAYEEILAPLGITTAQVLLTLEDSENRRRYLNFRSTMINLLGFKVVAIVNENDTIATDEIRYGDNDRLAASVASMIGADLLILLSDVDGLYTANPKENTSAKHLAIITKITPEIELMAGGAGSSVAKGGMKTKIMAAKTAMRSGCGMVIMFGDVLAPLSALAKGVKHSFFKPKSNPDLARKQWISGMKSKGVLSVDRGAGIALKDGNSLLAVGVISTKGDFYRGDMVEVQTTDGVELAKGLVNYDATEVDAISGHHSSEIKKILGYPGRAVLIHRDDMVI